MGDIGLREMRDVFTLGPGAYVTDETRTFQTAGRAGVGEESSVPMAPGPVLSSVTLCGTGWIKDRECGLTRRCRSCPDCGSLDRCAQEFELYSGSISGAQDI